MNKSLGELRSFINALDSEDLKEAERFFNWAQSYERKGLKIAADAMRDEGRKAFNRYLAGSHLPA